jgi:hypothetical protein
MCISKVNQWCQYNDLKEFLLFFVLRFIVLMFVCSSEVLRACVLVNALFQCSSEVLSVSVLVKCFVRVFKLSPLSQCHSDILCASVLVKCFVLVF